MTPQNLCALSSYLSSKQKKNTSGSSPPWTSLKNGKTTFTPSQATIIQIRTRRVRVRRLRVFFEQSMACLFKYISSKLEIPVDGRNPANSLRLVVLPHCSQGFIHPRWNSITRSIFISDDTFFGKDVFSSNFHDESHVFSFSGNEDSHVGVDLAWLFFSISR